MSSIKSISDGLKLDKTREAWLQNWLTRFGTWVHSGRIDKRQSSMIAQFMERVERRDYPYRPTCSDEDGLLIQRVVDSIYHIDIQAFNMLLSRYAFCASDRAIARYYHKNSEPRIMARRNGMLRERKPSMSTCRREVEEILNAVEYLLYQPLVDAFKNREKEMIEKRNSKNVLTSLN
ncbi:antiterminator Q family protein [Proteus mirabilis]|uniref:antiterminator Q family protein n=1 Tax=Proteus mirabilis TaxID=584 RepID=UPI000538C717|nr:antiterminator Q family protein [Proteus mirabilis]AUU36015.1 DUF1133 domain-containing protein [Proteus mirabilis]EKW2644126.1 DUF1133 family protein [Proteus mirabilis]EME2731671.1 DUF1133 family protein [Proteus mirabilis]RYH16740.1 DUF1133 family protein [Proteus mirabilis]RZA39847.1 DUF1133 family protein [Proteus mirabilis]